MWIVSVSMISEGTDIPRLQVCCYLSHIRTELYYRQVLGRVMRVTSSAEAQIAWLYTFSEPNLITFAHRVSDDIPDEEVVFSEKSALNQFHLEHSAVCDIPALFEHIDIEFTQSNNQELIFSEQSESPSTVAFGSFREQVVSVFMNPF